MSEMVRIFEDGKFQYIVNGKPSTLYDPYREDFRRGDIFRIAIAVLDHGFDKFSRQRRLLYRNIPFQILVEWFGNGGQKKDEPRPE